MGCGNSKEKTEKDKSQKAKPDGPQPIIINDKKASTPRQEKLPSARNTTSTPRNRGQSLTKEGAGTDAPPLPIAPLPSSRPPPDAPETRSPSPAASPIRSAQPPTVFAGSDTTIIQQVEAASATSQPRQHSQTQSPQSVPRGSNSPAAEVVLPIKKTASEDEITRLKRELSYTRKQLADARRDSASRSPDYVGKINDGSNRGGYGTDPSSEDEGPVLNDVMRAHAFTEVSPSRHSYDTEGSDDLESPPRLHSHSTRLRKHQMTAQELLEEAPPPPTDFIKRGEAEHRKLEAMGDPREVGTWAWWSRGSDKYSRDGASMTSDDPDAVTKLRGLRKALEDQMEEDSSPVICDVSMCQIGVEGCYSLSALLASPKISHTNTITTLDLSNNTIKDEGLGILFQAFTQHAQDYQRLPLPLVRKLLLSNCGLHHGCGLFIALHLFFGEICLFPDLEVLDLSYNSITPDAFRTILEALTSRCGASSMVKVADFSECHLGPLAFVYLLDTLKQLNETPTALRKLIVSGHHFGAESEKIPQLAPRYLTVEVQVPTPKEGELTPIRSRAARHSIYKDPNGTPSNRDATNHSSARVPTPTAKGGSAQKATTPRSLTR